MIKKFLSRSEHSASGFILPLVVAIGFILVAGGMTLAARSISGVLGSIRQQKSRQARETAEIGLAITMEALNGGFGYLMINCYPNPIDSNGTASGPYFRFGNSKLPVANSCFHTGGWGTDTPDQINDSIPEFPSSLCPGSRLGHPSLSDHFPDTHSRYRIDYYAFNGTEFYGGKGTLQITAEILSKDSSSILATSTIRQTFNVITEPCGGFPGLLMIHDGDLGNNDILGLQSGNVHCIGCTVTSDPNDQGLYTREQLEEAIGAKNLSEITGNITIGPLSFPPVPQFPTSRGECRQLNGVTTSCYSLADYNEEQTGSNQKIIIEPINIGKNTDISDHDHNNNGLVISAGNKIGALHVERVNSTTDTSGDTYKNSKGSSEIKDFCVVLPEGTDLVTHCLINNIDLSGQKTLTVNSTNGPVRLYAKGYSINASGQGGIKHEWDEEVPPPASRLGLFGIRPEEVDASGQKLCTSNIDKLTDPRDEDFIQKVTLSGGVGLSHLFAYFPCGVTGINGGSTGESVNGICEEPGDMNGAIWTAYWGRSDSNNAELCVPDDMVNQLRYFFGSDFALSVRRYRAQGISDWRGFQGLSQ